MNLKTGIAQIPVTGTPDAAPLWSARGRTWELLGDLGIELGIERSNSGMVKTCDVN